MQLIVYYSGVGATYLVDLPDGAANTVQDVLSMLLQQFNVAAPLGSPTVAGTAGSASPSAGEPPSELALKFGACHCCGAWRCNASCLLCGTHGWGQHTTSVSCSRVAVHARHGVQIIVCSPPLRSCLSVVWRTCPRFTWCPEVTRTSGRLAHPVMRAVSYRTLTLASSCQRTGRTIGHRVARGAASCCGRDWYPTCIARGDRHSHLRRLRSVWAHRASHRAKVRRWWVAYCGNGACADCTCGVVVMRLATSTPCSFLTQKTAPSTQPCTTAGRCWELLCASWMPGHCQLPKSKQMMAPPRHQQPLTPVPMPATHPRLMVQTTSLQATVLALALELELELAQEVEVMRLLAP